MKPSADNKKDKQTKDAKPKVNLGDWVNMVFPKRNTSDKPNAA